MELFEAFYPGITAKVTSIFDLFYISRTTFKIIKNSGFLVHLHDHKTNKT